MYYRGAAGAVIVYDVSDPNSLKNARGWYTQLKMLGEPGVQVSYGWERAVSALDYLCNKERKVIFQRKKMVSFCYTPSIIISPCRRLFLWATKQISTKATTRGSKPRQLPKYSRPR